MANMYNDIGKIIRLRVKLGEVIIDCKRQHTERVVIVLGDILCENSLQILPRKSFDIRVVGNIKVIVPVGKLILRGIMIAIKGGS